VMNDRAGGHHKRIDPLELFEVGAAHRTSPVTAPLISLFPGETTAIPGRAGSGYRP
jgi:hypothetical protein